MAKLCWHVEPEGFVFHYTDPWAARAIQAADLFVTSSVVGLYGHGLYATDLPPDTTPADELLQTLWHGAAPDLATSAVVILARDDELLPFQEEAPHILRHPVPGPRHEVDLSGLLVGIGVRGEEPPWKFDASLYV